LAPSKFNYSDLSEAFRLILDQNATLIAIHKSKYFKGEEGMALGPGTFGKKSIKFMYSWDSQ